MSTALILSGGGARAAYQVGVLKAVAAFLPSRVHNPFPIICGTSAGAINTLTLAAQRGNFSSRVATIEEIWRNLSAHHIYKTDAYSLIKNALKLGFGRRWASNKNQQALALLDNSPLWKLLKNTINFHHIDEAIASHYLQAVAVTAMSYSSGQSISFFQGNHNNWQRARRLGIRTGLSLEHLMASAAIPTLFPPVKIGSGYFGDGALRQLKPLSPALHLGAEKLFIIGVSDNNAPQKVTTSRYQPPTVAEMMGHILNSAFIDTLESDLETLRAINKLAEKIPGTPADGAKPIEHLCITPSQGINALAENYIDELPPSIRFLLRLTRGKGEATSHNGSAASYLLFEPGFCNELINLGYQDCLKQEKEVLAFFNIRQNEDSTAHENF